MLARLATDPEESSGCHVGLRELVLDTTRLRSRWTEFHHDDSNPDSSLQLLPWETINQQASYATQYQKDLTKAPSLPNAVAEEQLQPTD